MARRLYHCIQENEEFRQVFEQGAAFGVTSEGMTQESATDLVEYMLSSREFFVLSYEAAVAVDPSMVDILQDETEMCESTIDRQAQASNETDALAGDLYDCIQDNEEYKQLFTEEMGDPSTKGMTKEEAMAGVEIMLASRESFIVTFRLVAETTGDPLFDEFLEFMLDECRSG